MVFDVRAMNAGSVRRARHAAWVAHKRVRYGGCRIASTSDRRFKLAIGRAAVVSLDVFDTALFRCCPNPVDVFEITGHRLKEAGELSIDPETYRELRAAAERKARQTAVETGCEEVTLPEIYAELKRELPRLDVNRAVAEELSVERAVCTANPDVKRLYDSLQAQGRRVVFVSDSYLAHDVVAELLENCGYTGAHELLVSNVYCATKEHGTLFPLVAELLDVEPDTIVHLGDNIRADVQSAQRCGVTAFWYGGRIRARRHGTTLGDRVFDRMAALATATGAKSTEERVLRDVSYGVLAPIFVGLVQWLVERVRNEPADLVLFCARDGYFLHQIYERFARRVVLPPAVYFEVSRRSLAFPSITAIDERALDILCANFAALEVAQYFSRIGLDIADYPAELEAAGLRPDSLVHDPDSRLRLRMLFGFMELPVLERAKAERELTMAYLRECGVLDARRIMLVDIGWGGTLQQALARLLAGAGEPREIRGYYLSTDDRILKLDEAAGPARAWFVNASEPAWMQDQMLPGYWLLEIAFAAQHGTVLGYYRDGEKVRAEHHVYDPGALNARAARSIQFFSGEVLTRWLRIFAGIGPPLPMLSAFARFQRFSQHPSHEEARFFGDIVHVGGLGSTTEKQPVASPPALEVAVRQPRVLLNAYRESPWQVAFLQRVFRSNALACATLNVRSVFRRTRSNLKTSLKHLGAAAHALRG